MATGSDADSDDGFGSRSELSFLAKNVPSQNQQVASSSGAPVSSTMGLDIQSMAMIMSRQGSTIVMPWERGLMGQLFCKPASLVPVTNFSIPPPTRVDLPLKPTVETVIAVPVNIKRPIVPFVLRKLRSIDVPDLEDLKRNMAINKWRIIIEYNLSASQAGRYITELVEDGRADHLIMAVLRDTFAGKKTSTMNKRGASILRFLRWCKVPSSGVLDPMQFTERDCYKYATFLKESQASASAAKSFKEALNFMMYVIGMPHILEASKSTRISGSATIQLSKKRTLKQATEYTVNQVRLLHHILQNAPDDRDKVLIGYDLFTIYGTCRFSDAMNPSEFKVDLDDEGYGFIELYTNDHKGSTTDERRNLFLPLVAMSPGLCATPWAPIWLKARRATGLKFCRGPTMPAPNSQGGWCQRALSSSEAGQWTRELLAAYGPVSLTTRRITTHSGKVTLLSMACKWGMDRQHRKLLGHHLEKGEHSLVTYSRAALDIPLQQVVQMLQDVNDGVFDPDSSRLVRQKMARAVLRAKGHLNCEAQDSGNEDRDSRRQYDESSEADQLFDAFVEREFEASDAGAKSPSVPVPTQPCETASVTSDDSDDSDSSSSDDSDAVCEAKEDEKACAELSFNAENRPLPFMDSKGGFLKVLQHVHSGTLHCRKSDTHLQCNRLINRSYSVVSTLKLSWPICAQCRRQVPIVKYVEAVSKAAPSVPS